MSYLKKKPGSTQLEVLQWVRYLTLAVSLVTFGFVAWSVGQLFQLLSERNSIEEDFTRNRYQFSIDHAPPSFVEHAHEEKATIQKLNLRVEQALKLMRNYYESATAHRNN